MQKKIFITGLFTVMLCFGSLRCMEARTIDPDVYYYIKVYAATSYVGNLQVNPNDESKPDTFLTVDDAGNKYYLTLATNGDVKFSPESSPLTKISFYVKPYRFTPGDNYYRIRVKKELSESPSYLGYLSADTLKKPEKDSLRIDRNKTDLTLWKFKRDAIINDSTVYKIINKVTLDTLAFKIPETVNDTIAAVSKTDTLKQWWTPFSDPDSRTGVLETRDNATDKQYFLGVDADTVVMLVGASSPIDSISFLLEDETVPTSLYRFDTTMVYKIKYKIPTNQRFTGVEFNGSPVWLDTVHAHVPDGQFIANSKNTHSLINRTLEPTVTDTIEYCFYLNGDTMPDTYLYKGDSVVITPVDNAGYGWNNPYLGYKYVSPEAYRDSSFYFVCSKPDSLTGRILGADNIVRLQDKDSQDTATFLLSLNLLQPCATGFKDIATLYKPIFQIRSEKDSSFSLSSASPSELTQTTYDVGYFYLKEDTLRDNYYPVVFDHPKPVTQILTLNADDKRLHSEKFDAALRMTKSLFRIGQKLRQPVSEDDPYTYLKQFPDAKGKGFYQFDVYYEPPAMTTKNLTKDYYDYAALGLEGESMLRAGSYTPYDLHLWTDTAVGYGANADKPSFYIVKDADTTSAFAGANKFYIQGYFLHVMDSSRLSVHDDYVVNVGGKEYNRLNFVHAKRTLANQLELVPSGRAIISASALREYQFHFQETGVAGETNKYYLVSEGYGESSRSYARGYLSRKDDTLYVGPRDNALKVQLKSSTVANEPIAPIPVELAPEVVVVGGVGQIDLYNATGQPVYVYNILGRQVAQLTPATDHASIPLQPGILIVRTGAVIRKVVVR